MKGLSGLALGLALLTGASSAQASSIIYDGGSPDHNTIAFADANYALTMDAEPFSLQLGASTITDAHWWGGCFNLSTGAEPCPSGNFTLGFYTNNSDAPGTLIQSFKVGAASQTLTGDSILGTVPEYAYSAVFGPLALTPGTTYWFAVGDNTGQTDTWGMETTNDTGTHQQFATGTGWTLQADALAFNLTGGAITEVPEPATLSLLGLGLVGASLRCRRNR